MAKHLTGFDDEVQLGQLGEILENDSVVMSVEFADEDGKPIRPAGEPLWRGVTMIQLREGPLETASAAVAPDGRQHEPFTQQRPGQAGGDPPDHQARAERLRRPCSASGPILELVGRLARCPRS